ncbi:MAG: aminodeoxychorismate/anthranilate synthase component II [Chitinophagales bacterium]|nr:aminodeoxychorismate/anthranilate synthase component II [Chitinophagales bacterium]
MKILVLDNYDSFTYNLVYLLKKIENVELEVHRNDKIGLNEIGRFDKIILSPGPGIPGEAGILLEVIREYCSKKSILGVCLGHQAIAEAFGGTLFNLNNVFHGIATSIEISGDEDLFHDVPKRFIVGRYHSWAVNRNELPPSLEITAYDDEGNIMALRHKKFDVRGVQFHPESILTDYGEQIIKNWTAL